MICVITILYTQRSAKPMREAAADSLSEAGMLPGEIFIRRQMINEDGTLKTNLQPRSTESKETAQGAEALSESIGLWLAYALEKNDQMLFEQNVDVLSEHFMEDGGWIYWKIGQDGPVTTNALIDDLRIMEALYKASGRWSVSKYKELADAIAGSLLKNQLTDEIFTDFYDRASQWTSPVLTLSYLSPSALKEMLKHERLPEPLYNKGIKLLTDLPENNGFFPFSYDVSTEQYSYNDEVHLIDLLYVIYHRAQAGVRSDESWLFLKDEFYMHEMLYGRYDADSKQPSVSFESPAVYGLAILCALEFDEDEFARDLYYRMIRYQTRDPDSKWYGGYVDYHTNDTHIFDNLVPLLAERKMLNEGLLR
ncbi:hypothetical protein [Paenibacillus sp. 32O-W]|uniref:hypothetical protein n=1 Tax=Paenibacillus sp. 32O-W TaxID=1695218 RepID=UPI001C92F23F|nr:hypothetical protein [Paenibacillus sp. 32O-W]